MNRKCFLAIYAHPDDESFSVAGIFRKYSDAGIKTALLCATRGEQGGISDTALATPETLGQVREQELRAACRIVGVEDVSFLGYGDGTLPDVDEKEAIGRIVYHIRRLQPQVMVTFDANGDYGHPDHMVLHRLAVSAFHLADDPTAYPEQLHNGVRPYAPQKLYAHAMAWSVMRKVYAQVRAKGGTFGPGGSTATIPVSQMGTPDEEITAVIPLTPSQFSAKLEALLAHRTQTSSDGPFSRSPSEAVLEWLSVERFKRLVPADVCGHEDDLFAGVTYAYTYT